MIPRSASSSSRFVFSLSLGFFSLEIAFSVRVSLRSSLNSSWLRSSSVVIENEQLVSICFHFRSPTTLLIESASNRARASPVPTSALRRRQRSSNAIIPPDFNAPAHLSRNSSLCCMCVHELCPQITSNWPLGTSQVIKSACLNSTKSSRLTRC